MWTKKDIKAFAYFLGNVDFNMLADNGVLFRNSNGNPTVGGCDWKRFNKDPISFFMKLPDEQMDKFATLAEKEMVKYYEN